MLSWESPFASSSFPVCFRPLLAPYLVVDMSSASSSRDFAVSCASFLPPVLKPKRTNNVYGDTVGRRLDANAQSTMTGYIISANDDTAERKLVIKFQPAVLILGERINSWNTKYSQNVACDCTNALSVNHILNPNTKRFKHGHTVCKLSRKSLLSSHKTTLKQQVNGLKQTLIYFNTDIQYTNFRGNPLYQATKRHLSNR